ncbi:MAG: hypothetical protein ACYCTF_12425 [Acidiferrobacter sp.]
MHNPYGSCSRKDRPHGTGNTLRQLALFCVVLGTLAAASPPAAASIDRDARHVGHSLGTAAREVGHKAKHVGLAIGHAAKKAGLEVGHAAKAGGLAFWHAVKGHHH